MTPVVKIKICGIRTPEAALAAADAGADMIGLMFVPDSPRYVELSQAVQIAQAVGDRVRLVGVFKGQPVPLIEQAVAVTPLSCVQLHGEDAVDRALELAPSPAVVSIAFHPESAAADLRTLLRRAREIPSIEAVLIDTPDPTRLGGGTGRTFDWNALRAILDEVHPELPVVLAGGLNPQNVGRAIQAVRPWAVDVSSGVESSRGVKDVELIRAFCRIARFDSSAPSR